MTQIQALLDAHMATIATRIVERNGNMDELISQFATYAMARSSSSGSVDNQGNIVGGTKTQIFTANNEVINIPSGCKLIYLLCKTHTTILETEKIILEAPSTYTMSAGEFLNLEYPGAGGHGAITVNSTGETVISLTR